MWQKIKGFFRTIFSNSETVNLTQVVVSSYYLGMGILLALASNSLVFLLIFSLPATIWWITVIAHTSNLILKPNSA